MKQSTRDQLPVTLPLAQPRGEGWRFADVSV